jgi:methionine aminotransferase
MGNYQKPEGSYISFMSNKVKKQGGINLAQGIPGFQPPAELLNQLSQLAFDPIHQYAPGTGNSDLLKLLATKYKRYGNFEDNDFLVTNGGTEAVSLIYTYLNKILEKPYSALAFEPVYESYKMLPPIFNDHFIPFALNEDHTVNFTKLKETCIQHNVRILFLNTPGNPLGKIWKKEEVNELLAITQDLNIYVIVDAVYQELYFSGEPHNPVEYFNDNMFYVNSFSKLFSITGWRIGYLIASEIHMSKIQGIHDYTGLCVPSILQAALAMYIKENQWGKDYIQNLRGKLQESFHKLKNGLESLQFSIPPIEGGYFIWARLPNEWNDGFDFTMELYEKEKVAVIPGEHFSERSRNFVRFNIAREPEEMKEALVRIQRFFDRYSE